MKRTPLYHKHIALGAKMVPFAGYEMPVSYTGIKEEHRAVRQQIGMFDVSHMGEFLVKGPKALPFINYATSNDAGKLLPGRAQYSCMPNREGGIVDDLLVYMIGENDYMLVVNGACLEKDWNWLSEINKGFDADLTDVSDNTALMAIQGPLAVKALQKLCAVNLSEIPFYQFRIGTFAGVENIIISNTGYTGAGGFELYAPAHAAAAVWDAIVDAGKEFGLMPAGLGCRDTLRLEMGYCLYGNDITDTTSPLEAGLGWITKLDKEGGFVGLEPITRQKAQGIPRKLVALEMIDKAIPRHDYPLCDAQGNQVGFVTSGTHSPSLDKAIALGYVPVEMAREGQEVFVSVRNKLSKARVVKLPFYKQP